MNDEKNHVKKNQKLPPQIKKEFERISKDNVTRDALIRRLVDANWTYEAISNASGLTRERVRQIAALEDLAEEFNFDLRVEIPEPPLKPIKAKPVYIEPSEQTLKRLLELQPYAQQVRANGDKYRKEAEEYTALLNHAHTVEGVTLYRLAKRLGVTHGALRFRLVRYGYKKAITATSKVYTPVIRENRAI